MDKKDLLLESKVELIERARELDLPGRSRMSKEELAAEIEKALARIEAARARRSRAIGGAPVRKAVTSTKARRAIEERSRRRRELAEAGGAPKSAEAPEQQPIEVSVNDDGDIVVQGGARRVKPSRAGRKKGVPGLDGVDLENSLSSTRVARSPQPKKPKQPVRIPEDRLTGAPLPKQYGRDRFVLLTRDPRWLFAYWEILPGTEEKIFRKAAGDLGPDAQRILRIFECTGEGEETANFFDIQIHPGARSWYIHLPTAGLTWKVEIGFVGKSGKFYKILGSNLARTPRKSVSPVVDEKYRTLDEEFDEIFRLSGGAMVGRGLQGFGGSAVPPGAGKKARGRALPAEELERWQWPFPTSGGMWSGLPYASGIPAQPAPARKQDDFFFWVNTELILYGGTQPTATVTVQGKKVKLRPDGTFTLRYALPDGVVDMPCVAVRADGKQTRKARPIVTRRTK